MGFKYLKKMPSPDEVLGKQPLTKKLKEVKKKRDLEIEEIFLDNDKRFILIIGPCSAHNEDALCEYVNRLAAIQEKVKDKLFLIPRIYTNKPRTTGLGYKGMLHQPDHKKKPNMVKGLWAIRHMHLRAFSESHLSAADEMLYPGNYPYLADVLSYVAIGARSVENQQHRLTSSGLTIPVGMKNPTSGDINVMLDAICAAQNSHIFIYNGWEVQTRGNILTHAILRGAVDSSGRSIPNYYYENLRNLAETYQKRELLNPAIIVDVNHANSGKKYREQPRISKEIMYKRKNSPLLRKTIKGLMIESYLLEGSQDAAENEFGRSITDPCLGWEDSEKLIYKLAELC